MSPKRKRPSAHLIEAFLDMMSAERGAGANTLAAYARDLGDFANHADPAAASRADIQAFLSVLAATTAPSTQARKLSALRQFYGFLHAEGFRADDPTLTLVAPGHDGRCPGFSAAQRWKSCWPPRRAKPRRRRG